MVTGWWCGATTGGWCEAPTPCSPSGRSLRRTTSGWKPPGSRPRVATSGSTNTSAPASPTSMPPVTAPARCSSPRWRACRAARSPSTPSGCRWRRWTTPRWPRPCSPSPRSPRWAWRRWGRPPRDARSAPPRCPSPPTSGRCCRASPGVSSR